MPASHGSNADIYGNGYVLSDYLNSASFSGQRDTAETTTFKKKSKTYMPGLKDSTLTAEGIWDGALDAVDQIFWAAFGANTDGLISYLPEGNEVVGRPAWSLDFIENSYEVNTEIGDVAQISAEFAAGANGRFTRGLVGLPFAVRGAGGNGVSVDGGATSAGVTDKASLVVHATAAASLVVKYQHSTDQSTWVDVGTLNFGSVRGSQRLAIASGNVNRYTRVLWTGTGTFMAILER